MDEQIAERIVDGQTSMTAATQDRSPMLEISNAMVGLYKEAFGRGPTKARAQFAGPDTLVVILEASLTVAERNMVAMGEHQRLREARLFFQHALEDQFRAIVEESLGRRTLAFVSGIDTSRDVAIEVFTLEPQAEDGAGPSDS
ncbi:MAG TPA: Na-translocating system protein MpsC family protein [Solirubrobacteraceae bacterium]|nr:Na-translocating system protein MpsC family protein [Solirubrobacteraceae bacterium]